MGKVGKVRHVQIDELGTLKMTGISWEVGA